MGFSTFLNGSETMPRPKPIIKSDFSNKKMILKGFYKRYQKLWSEREESHNQKRVAKDNAKRVLFSDRLK